MDYLIDYPFTGDLMTMEAERFIQKILYEKLHAAHIVVGSDFSFGYRKRGDHQMLERYAQKYDYTVDVVEKHVWETARSAAPMYGRLCPMEISGWHRNFLDILMR